MTLVDAPFSLYPYDPSHVLPIVFTILNTIIFVAIFMQTLLVRWWHFMFMTTWGSIVWIPGFIMRTISSYSPRNIPLFIAQYVLVFCGPPIFAASEYFILGRLYAYLPYHTPIHPGRVISTFLFFSGVVEALATNGATTASNSNLSPATIASAVDRIKASLILQEVVEMTFFSMVALLEYHCRRTGVFPQNVRTVCRVLYVTSLMMTLRCIIRTVSGFDDTNCTPQTPGYVHGYCGPVNTQEWWLWVFEVANITVFILLLAVWHPGRLLPKDYKQYLAPDGQSERLGPGYSQADDRNWVVTSIDPFNLWGMAKGKGVKPINKFWEQDNPVAEKWMLKQ